MVLLCADVRTVQALVLTCVLGLTLQICAAPCAPAAASATSTCTGFVACQESLCHCAGVTDRPAASFGCLAFAPSDMSCASLFDCNVRFEQCVSRLIMAQRANFSDSCGSWASFQYVSALNAASDGYDGSRLQQECLSRRCLIVNKSATSEACPTAGNASTLCAAQTVVTAPNVLFNASLRIVGRSFGVLLANAPRKLSLSDALRTDLALLLRIPVSSISVTSLTLGSLLANFSVFAATGSATATTLVPRLGDGNSSAGWLASVQDVYSTVSDEELRVGGITVAGAAGALLSRSPSSSSTVPAGPTLTPSPPRASPVPRLSISAAPTLARGAIATVVASLLAIAAL